MWLLLFSLTPTHSSPSFILLSITRELPFESFSLCSPLILLSIVPVSCFDFSAHMGKLGKMTMKVSRLVVVVVAVVVAVAVAVVVVVIGKYGID